jgi:hypothetical protein
MAFDLSRLRRGEQIAAGAGVLLFILMFFDWYNVSVDVGGGLGSFGVGGNAWQVFDLLDIYLFVVILAAVGLAFLTATQRTPALPITASVIVAALGALGTLLVLYRLINTPIGDVPDGIDVGRTIWAFLGLVAVAGITYGGYLSMREEGTSLSDARDQARAAAGQARSAFENAAPRNESESAAAPPPPPPAAPPAEPVASPSPVPADPAPVDDDDPPSGSTPPPPPAGY